MTASASFDLVGRVALVTGGNGGIGRGIALGFAGAGPAVAILGRNAEKNAQVLGELRATGVPCMAVAVDVTDRPALVPSYGAAKGAIVQLTKSMAIELAPHGIQVNALASRPT